MSPLDLTHTRVVRACRRRTEKQLASASERADAEQRFLAHAEERRQLEHLHDTLRRLGGYKMTLTNELLNITTTARHWLFLPGGVVFVLGGGYSLFLSALNSHELSTLAFATCLLSLGCGLLVFFVKERPARVTVTIAAGDPMVQELMAWAVSMRPEVRRERLFRELSALYGARVDRAPSVWDQIVDVVRRGA